LDEELQVAKEEAKAPLKKKGFLSKVWAMTNMISGKKASEKDKIDSYKEKAKLETEVLATRFISFEESCIIML